MRPRVNTRFPEKAAGRSVTALLHPSARHRTSTILLTALACAVFSRQ
jgi:hypothetical protein